jgi:hypothetical protein
MDASDVLLQYPVLSDVDGVMLKAYKVGRGMLGMIDVARITFIIDKKGIVRCVWIFVECLAVGMTEVCQRCTRCDHELQRPFEVRFPVVGQIGGGGRGSRVRVRTSSSHSHAGVGRVIYLFFYGIATSPCMCTCPILNNLWHHFPRAT